MVPVLAALHVRVPNVPGGAGAVLGVAEGFALGVEAAGVGLGAGVDAGAGGALLVRLTVTVLPALNTPTLNLNKFINHQCLKN